MLKVRTAGAEKFNRAGLTFTREPIVLTDKQLSARLGPPQGYYQDKPPTVEEVLLAETMLVCEQPSAEEIKAAKGQEKEAKKEEPTK